MQVNDHWKEFVWKISKTNQARRGLTFDVIDSNPHGRIFSMRPTHSSTMSKLKNKKRNLEENEDEQVWFDIILI